MKWNHLLKPGRPKKAYDENGRVIAPDNQGVYRIIDSEGKHRYHGKATHLNLRIKDHETDGLIRTDDNVYFQEVNRLVTDHQLSMIEKEKIEKHKPYMNKSVGGEGRPSKRGKEAGERNVSNFLNFLHFFISFDK